MDIEIVKRAALRNPAAAAAIYNKSEIYSAVCGIAEQIRKPGESVFKARQRASATAEGIALMAAYNAAPKAKPAEKVARASVEDIRKSMSGGDVIAQIDEAARKIAADERLPMIRARAEAWKRNPDLKRAYDGRANLRTISGGRC